MTVILDFFQSLQDQNPLASPTIKDIECGIVNCNYRFALTGQTWQAIREYYPNLVDRICVRSAIFARMSSDQKQQLVVELMRLGYYVGMYMRARAHISLYRERERDIDAESMKFIFL